MIKPRPLFIYFFLGGGTNVGGGQMSRGHMSGGGAMSGGACPGGGAMSGAQMSGYRDLVRVVDVVSMMVNMFSGKWEGD